MLAQRIITNARQAMERFGPSEIIRRDLVRIEKDIAPNARRTPGLERMREEEGTCKHP
jgi:hypothetical protein